jgi:hypothetical protein
MERAQEHRDELDLAIREFFKTNPYEIVHEFDGWPLPMPPPPFVDARKGVHIYRATTKHPIPSHIPILAGDCLEGLRSALDYVAWQLALAQSDTPPDMTAFPIFCAEKTYNQNRQRLVGGIDPTTHPIFDSLQPYHAGNKATEHPLWVLHRLANDYKHRVPYVVGSLTSGLGFIRPPGVDAAIFGEVSGAFGDGEVVATVAILGGAKPETQLNTRISFGMAFGKDTPAHGRLLIAEIDRIGVTVGVAVEKFESFFP